MSRSELVDAAEERMGAKPTPRSIDAVPPAVSETQQRLRLIDAERVSGSASGASRTAARPSAASDDSSISQASRTEEGTMSALSVAARTDAAELRDLRASMAESAAEVLGLRDLLTRVEALLRRAAAGPGIEPQSSEAPERFGDIEVYLASRTVLRRGQLVTLSPTEFHLLLALLRRRGALATREELLREVWESEADRSTRRVDMTICRLRQKLEDNPAIPRHIVTVLKAGYRLRA
ncbi:MAG TPA: response regulator transcription factor [Gemmatimonadaceae bacterium]|nr:response regulator transcription factor [Gemmatimonadaceae bacterium]